jgi:diguanylate cyclase (GGDEF)-like protein
VPKHTPGSIDSLARDALRLSRRWGAGRLASWLLGALVLVYGVWFFGFATVHNGPTATLPVRALASDRPFSDLQAMRQLLADQPEQRKHKTGVDQPTTWLMATIPGVEPMHGVPQRVRTIHIPEKSIALADVALVDASGDARLWSRFGVGIATYKSQRALPGFSLEVPLQWNPEAPLTLLMRVEPAGVANNFTVDLWDARPFADAQVKLQQRTAMLIGALMLLTIYALAAAQAGNVPFLLVFAFWLVARCGYVMSSGGFNYFSFGEIAGSDIGMAARQLALLSFPCAAAALVWSLTQAELRRHATRKILRLALVLSCAAMAIGPFMPSAIFQLTMWVSAGVVIVAILAVIVGGFRLINNTVTRWYLGGLLLDVVAGLNELVLSLAFESPVPWLTLQQVSLVSAMLTGVAVGSMVSKEREKRLRAQEAAIDLLGKYEMVYRTVPIGLVSFGPEDRVERFNAGFARMFGLPLPARGCAPADDPAVVATLAESFPVALRNRIRAELHETGECDFPYRLGEDAQARWLRIMARGSQAAFEASVSDITEHKNTERRLAHAAEHDALTGALNRRGLVRLLGRMLQEGGEVPRHSLVYLDLDRFKLLNDLFGHPAGDLVLQEVVTRLQSVLGDRVAVARLGGDEFAALLPAAESERHEALAQAALAAIAGEPFRIPGHSFTVTASVGMFRCAGGLTQEALIAGADRACLDAKRKGRNQVVVQNDPTALIKRQLAELSALAEVGDADAFGDVELTIQPIISLQESGRLAGEFLVRERAPDGSLVAADVFLDAAEERGQMASVDRWVLRQALQWLSRHGERFPSLQFLSVNLSARALNDELFKTFVLALLRRHHEVSHLLVIEISESVAMQDVFVLEKFVSQLRETGARLALDDVGSGYSSFSSLDDVGANYLKIDGRFVRAMTSQGGSTTVIRTINVLAHELGMESIAGSIDDAQTLAVLKAMGADYGQGNALCPALPLDAFTEACARGTLALAPEIHAILGDERPSAPRPRSGALAAAEAGPDGVSAAAAAAGSPATVV